MSQPWHGGTRAGLRSQLQPQSRGCCALSSAHPLRVPQPLARAQHGLGFSTTQRDFSFLALRQSSSAPRSSTGIPSQLGCTGQLRGCWKGAAPLSRPSQIWGLSGRGEQRGAGAEAGEGRRSWPDPEGEPRLPRGWLGHAPGMSPSTNHRWLPAAAPSCPPPAFRGRGLRTPATVTSWLGESTRIMLTAWPRVPPRSSTASPGATKWAGKPVTTYLLLTCPEGLG